jgi:hypothetical protein
MRSSPRPGLPAIKVSIPDSSQTARTPPTHPRAYSTPRHAPHARAQPLCRRFSRDRFRYPQNHFHHRPHKHSGTPDFHTRTRSGAFPSCRGEIRRFWAIRFAKRTMNFFRVTRQRHLAQWSVRKGARVVQCHASRETPFRTTLSCSHSTSLLAPRRETLLRRCSTRPLMFRSSALRSTGPFRDGVSGWRAPPPVLPSPIHLPCAQAECAKDFGRTHTNLLRFRSAGFGRTCRILRQW